MGYITLFLGGDTGLMGCMSRCRGQFVHIPPPDKNENLRNVYTPLARADPNNVHIPPPRANPENHSEYEDRASCCKMC